MDASEWAAMRHEVIELFTPGAPIDEFALFAGRQNEIQRLQDTVASKGRHVIIFGERGVGKTSLANIFFLALHGPARKIRDIYVQCVEDDTFETVWHKVFRRIKFTSDGTDIWGDEIFSDGITPDDIQILISNFGPNDVPIIILDEYDRIRDDNTRVLMSETVKQLSNTASNCTIVFVGVADSVLNLIHAHESIARALVQVQMPRMTLDELKEIVTNRLNRTRLRIADDALWRIAFFSSGLPFYAHVLGQAVSLHAISQEKLRITEDMIELSLPNCFREVDQTLIDGYVKATVETRKGNIFKEVLAGASLADQDDIGRFSAANVEAPLTDIIGREMKTPSFSFHLNELCKEERGKILQKSGEKGHFRFRFVEPIMQPYITMKSLSNKIISNEILERYAIQRQLSLPNDL